MYNAITDLVAALQRATAKYQQARRRLDSAEMAAHQARVDYAIAEEEHRVAKQALDNAIWDDSSRS